MKFSCYYCGCGDAVRVARRTARLGDGQVVSRCFRCGLVQMFPPTEPSYDGYSEKEDFKGQKPRLRISRYLPKLLGKKTGIIVEVGCGRGDNVRWLRELGFKGVFGIDKDPAVTGAAIINRDWREYGGVIKHRAVYGIHFLEHVADPIGFMRWVRKVLKKNGTFIFEVPSIEDPLLALYKNRAFRDFYWYKYHMFFYNKRTLEMVLHGPGFRVIRRQEYGIVNHLRWALFGRPGNWNPTIPILDRIYKRILILLGYSDSLIVVGKNV